MIKYLALGDSYTYGEKVAPIYSFPYQLTQSLRKQNLQVNAPEIVAMTAWTTTDLLKHLSEYQLAPSYDICTLLIGVNNQYRGLDLSIFKKEYDQIVKIALDKVEQNSNRCILINIPDWGLTPYNKEKNKSEVSREIDTYNKLIYEKSQEIDCKYVDICSLSRQHADNSEYLVDDGLHPSEKAYSEWTKKILTQTLNLG